MEDTLKHDGAPAPRELDDAAFEATFVPPMIDITATADQLVDIWPYADAILADAFPDIPSDTFDVRYVYRDEDNRYHHVIINVGQEAFFLVVIVSVEDEEIFGHHFLNLDAKYSLMH